eukprot:RCo050820
MARLLCSSTIVILLLFKAMSALQAAAPIPPLDSSLSSFTPSSGSARHSLRHVCAAVDLEMTQTLDHPVDLQIPETPTLDPLTGWLESYANQPYNATRGWSLSWSKGLSKVFEMGDLKVATHRALSPLDLGPALLKALISPTAPHQRLIIMNVGLWPLAGPNLYKFFRLDDLAPKWPFTVEKFLADLREIFHHPFVLAQPPCRLFFRELHALRRVPAERPVAPTFNNSFVVAINRGLREILRGTPVQLLPNYGLSLQPCCLLWDSLHTSVQCNHLLVHHVLRPTLRCCQSQHYPNGSSRRSAALAPLREIVLLGDSTMRHYLYGPMVWAVLRNPRVLDSFEGPAEVLPLRTLCRRLR